MAFTQFLVSSRGRLRCFSTSVLNNDIVLSIFTNRNPRNLEKLRIGYKPDGYHVDNPGRNFWHNLEITTSGRHVTASVKHFENGEVIKASTQEWPIQKRLYSNKDTCAYINIGRILAQRCIECGIVEVNCTITPPKPDGKVALLLKALQDGGVRLEESPQYKPDHPWDQYRKEKPWEVI